jgi:acetyltransferase
MDDLHVITLSAADLEAEHDALMQLLRECVHGGASLGYLAPLSDDEAAGFWADVRAQVASGGRAVVAVREEGRIVGAGQLEWESRSNGRHRAQVCKVMVMPSHRRRGIAAQVMNELERIARERSIRLLYLDTSEGRGGATAFYETLGYTYAGGIPEWALDPDGTPAKNAIYYKLL